MDQNNEVEFEEEDVMLAEQRPQFEKKGMIGFVIKHSGGRIKNEKQANLVLMMFIVVVVVVTFMVIS